MTRSLRILVVDDDEDNAHSLGELFELEGHTAHVVHSGEEAVEAFRCEAFDVAFMDVMMPGKNGVDSFMEIRRLRPEARVYMMTGYSVEQLLRQAIDNGALGVMSKPWTLTRFWPRWTAWGALALLLWRMMTRLPGKISKAPYGGWQARLLGTLSRYARYAVSGDSHDVLIVDIKAPLIDGVEVYKDLRRSGRHAPTVIITQLSQSSRHAGSHGRSGDFRILTKNHFGCLMLLLNRLGQLAV